ncbi:MAG: hypothetical protein R3C45_09600 [Phycisphaerales bacterium]
MDQTSTGNWVSCSKRQVLADPLAGLHEIDHRRLQAVEALGLRIMAVQQVQPAGLIEHELRLRLVRQRASIAIPPGTEPLPDISNSTRLGSSVLFVAAEAATTEARAVSRWRRGCRDFSNSGACRGVCGAATG